MLILQKKRVRELSSNLPTVLKDKSLLLAIVLEGKEKQVERIGFSELTAGAKVLPKAIGPVTRFNAYGKDKVRKDLPKETVYHSALWTREEWAGRGETRTVTDIVYRRYERYPREHIDGTGYELTIAEKAGELYVVLDQPIAYTEANKADLLVAINLFLEIFGQVAIFDESLEPVKIPNNLKRLNWRILPPGKRLTKSELEEALKETLSRSKGVRAAEVARQELLSSFNPDVIAVGQGGFAGYVAYVFPKKGITLLESVRYGNATYVLDSVGWEDLSKLTKGELLSKKLAKGREIHTKEWLKRVTGLLDKS
jgi:hypothetical protein